MAIALGALSMGFLAYSLPTSSDPNLTDLVATKFTDLSGNGAKISDWRGKVRIVNFWATWCHPCREEIPGFVRLQEKYRDDGVIFIGVALDSEEQVKRFAEETQMNYPILLAGYEAMRLSRDAGNQSSALPFTVVIEPDGSFADAFSGVLGEEKLESVIQGLL
ncbi:MAG: TlpA family protein disulfide reductase [Burkholderiales bacterium]